VRQTGMTSAYNQNAKENTFMKTST